MAEHPCGIEPWGNFYMRGGGPNIRDAGLGNMSVLGDALILEIFTSGVLQPRDLGRLALASKSLYCFANLEDIWKGLVLEELGGRFTWCGCWQRTYLVSTGLLQPPAGQGQGQQEGAQDGGVGLKGQAEIEDESSEEEEEEGSAKPESSEEEEQAGAAAPAAAVEEGPRRQSKRLKTGDAKAEVVPAAEKKQKQGKEVSDRSSRNAKGADSNGNGSCRSTKDAKSCKGNRSSSSDKKEKANGKKAPSTAVAAASKTKEQQQHQPGEDRQQQPQRQHKALQQRRRRRLLRRVPGCGPQRYLRVRGFYSDLLYQPWFCATLEPPADWLEGDNIDRRSGLTAEQFRQEYEIPNRPVILTDAMSQWPALAQWSPDFLSAAFGDQDVIVGNMPMPFPTYRAYSAANRDEMPLYLFDRLFTQLAPSMASAYWPPEQFGEDLFSLLGEQGRPDYRWLIWGPTRSGSSFHVDPNATSAWNALLWGAKKWIMYPPGVVPPGVHPSPDGADVATPLSLTEWFVNFYAATKETKVRPIEFIARPGELLFVPRGWWHCALNLEDSCALTQNFVSAVGLPATLAFLKSRRPEMVSGCAHESRCNLYDRFVAALREQRPQILAAEEARQEEARARAREANRLAALFRAPCSDAAQQQQQKETKTQQSNQPQSQTSLTSANVNGGAQEGDAPSAVGGSSGGAFTFGFSFGGGAENGGAAEAGSGGGFKFGFGM